MIVIDTNVLIAGLLTGNQKALAACIADTLIDGHCHCLLHHDRHLIPDNHLWALLEAGPTARLATGDQRLLDKPFDKDRVMPPAAHTASLCE